MVPWGNGRAAGLILKSIQGGPGQTKVQKRKRRTPPDPVVRPQPQQTKLGVCKKQFRWQLENHPCVWTKAPGPHLNRYLIVLGLKEARPKPAFQEDG